MTTHINDVPANINYLKTTVPCTYLWRKYTVGATGAITAAGGDPNLVATKETAEGQYSLALPTGAHYAIWATWVGTSGATAVDFFNVLAADPSAGTATTQFYEISGDPGAKAAEDLASGETFTIHVFIYPDLAP